MEVENSTKIKRRLNVLKAIHHAFGSDRPYHVARGIPFTFIHISYASLRDEYKDTCKDKKKLPCDKSLYTHLKDLADGGAIIKINRGREQVNAYAITPFGYEILELDRQKKVKKARNLLVNGHPPSNPSVEPVSEVFCEKNLQAPYINLNKSNKSCEKDFSSPKVKVLGQELFDTAVEILGEKLTGRITEPKVRFLRGAHNKLGKSMEYFIAFLKKAMASTWLKIHSWFRLDWILKYENMDKILEGRYDDSPSADNLVENTQTSNEKEKDPIVAQSNAIICHFLKHHDLKPDASTSAIEVAIEHAIGTQLKMKMREKLDERIRSDGDDALIDIKPLLRFNEEKLNERRPKKAYT